MEDVVESSPQGMATRLSVYEWNGADLEELCLKLEEGGRVQLLKLANCKLEMCEARSIFEALSRHSSVTELDLSMNAQTDDHAQLLGEMLSKNSSIKSLCLTSACLTEQCLQVLAHGLNKNTVLQKLDLSCNNLGAGGSCPLWKTIAHNNSLTPLHSLSLSSTGITHQDIPALAEALRRNTTLRVLNLSMNKLGEDGAREISKVLYPYPSHTERNDKEYTSAQLSLVSHVGIIRGNTCHASQDDQAAEGKTEEDTKEDVSPPHDSMPKNKKQEALHTQSKSRNCNDCVLLELDLSHNDISAAGATAIAWALAHNTTLQKLDMSNNNITGEGCMEICRACMHSCVKNSHIQERGEPSSQTHTVAYSASYSHAQSNRDMTLSCLNLSTNTQEATGQAYSAPDSHAQSQSQNNTTITYLNLSTNRLEASGAQYIAHMLSHNHTLRTLDVTHNQLTEAGLTSIASSLTRNTTLLHLILWSNNLQAHSAHAFAEAIKTNRTLRCLDFTSFSLSPDDIVTPFGPVLKNYPRYHHFSLHGVPLWKVADILGSPQRETDWSNDVILDDLDRIHRGMLLAFVMGTHASLGSESVVKIWRECADVCCVVGALFYGLPVSFFYL